MEKARKIFKGLGWFMIIVCLLIIGFGMLFNTSVLVPLSLSITAGALFMFISIGIDIISDLSNR